MMSTAGCWRRRAMSSAVDRGRRGRSRIETASMVTVSHRSHVKAELADEIDSGHTAAEKHLNLRNPTAEYGDDLRIAEPVAGLKFVFVVRENCLGVDLGDSE
jgi:hypothetical protein